MELQTAAYILCSMNSTRSEDISHPILPNLRRPVFSEISRGVPTTFWVRETVRKDGRIDKKYYSPMGQSYRSMKSCVKSLAKV